MSIPLASKKAFLLKALSDPDYQTVLDAARRKQALVITQQNLQAVIDQIAAIDAQMDTLLTGMYYASSTDFHPPL